LGAEFPLSYRLLYSSVLFPLGRQAFFDYKSDRQKVEFFFFLYLEKLPVLSKKEEILLGYFLSSLSGFHFFSLATLPFSVPPTPSGSSISVSCDGFFSFPSHGWKGPIVRFPFLGFPAFVFFLRHSRRSFSKTLVTCRRSFPGPWALRDAIRFFFFPTPSLGSP